MILLLGGTSDAAILAQRLAEAGCKVLVSQATEAPVAMADHSGIERRSGPLDDDSLASLIRQRDIRAIVDAAHPYAATIHQRARRVAERLHLPCLRFVRPPVIAEDDPAVEFAADHSAAAKAAFAHGRPVLLTTGSTHLEPYVAQERRTGVPLIVRVLDQPASIQACRAAGLADESLIAARGPFSLEDNVRQIRACRIGVLVTKDGGQPGGTLEKLAAARLEACRVVVLSRPAVDGVAYGDIEALVKAVMDGGGRKGEGGKTAST